MTDLTPLRSERELAAEILAAVRTLREVFGQCEAPDAGGLFQAESSLGTRKKLLWLCPGRREEEIAVIPSRLDTAYTAALLAELWRLRANRAARKGAAA